MFVPLLHVPPHVNYGTYIVLQFFEFHVLACLLDVSFSHQNLYTAIPTDYHPNKQTDILVSPLRTHDQCAYSRGTLHYHSYKQNTFASNATALSTALAAVLAISVDAIENNQKNQIKFVSSE